MIKTRNLSRVYRTNAVETRALNDVTLNIGPGEFVSIMGPSGSGKSTLLHILGMLDSPTTGSYFFDGENLSEKSQRQRDLARRGNIGFVFQSFNLIDDLTAAENVAVPLEYAGFSAEETKERVDQALDRVRIAHRRTHRPQQLSGGQQQRVAIARSIAARPQVILADEPTGNLDAERSHEVLSMLQEIRREGTIIVMVTHSKLDAEYTDRTVHLFDGRVVSDSATPERERRERTLAGVSA